MDGPLWTICHLRHPEAPVLSIFVLPWRWTREPRPGHALVFASRFDAAGARSGWLLFAGGLRLRRAVLRAPGALGVALYAQPLRGRYQTLSMWRDEKSLLAFAHGQAHLGLARRLAQLDPGQGVLVSREADSGRRPTWRHANRWLATAEPGPYRQDLAGQPQRRGKEPAAG
jgi:hypothetical protein